MKRLTTPSAWLSGVPTGDGFICSDSGSTCRLSAATVLIHAMISPPDAVQPDVVRAELVVFWPVVGCARGVARLSKAVNFRAACVAAPSGWRAPARHRVRKHLRRLTHSARTQPYAAGSAARPARGIAPCEQASKSPQRPSPRELRQRARRSFPRSEPGVAALAAPRLQGRSLLLGSSEGDRCWNLWRCMYSATAQTAQI